MKKIIIAVLLLQVISTSSLLSQDFKSIEDLKRRFFERVLTITGENDKVEGYVVYYMSEKQKKGMRTFAVQTYDLDLQEVALSKLDVTKNTNILSTAFNGQNLCVILGDARKKNLKAVTYDKAGKKQGQIDWTLKKWYEADANVYPSETGFYLVRTMREKKTGFQVEHLTNSLSREWKKNFVPQKGYTGVLLAKSIDDKIIFVKEQGPSVLSKKLTLELITMNESDGKVEGKFFLFDGKNTFIPSAIKFDEQGNSILGGMYFEGIKFKNTNSTGVFVMKTKSDGKDKKVTSLPWKGEMQKYLKQSKSKGPRIDAKNKILFEDIMVHENGYQLIGETFSKSIIGLSLADVVIGNNNGTSRPTLINIKDIMVFNFENDFKFKNVQIIPKKEINVSCFPPYAGMYGMRLAVELQKLGYLNYRFTMKDTPMSEEFTLISTNQGDLLDNIKKGTRYSITKVKPSNLVPQEQLKDIKLYDQKSKIKSYGLLRNTSEKLMIFYYDPKFDAVRLYLDDLTL